MTRLRSVHFLSGRDHSLIANASRFLLPEQNVIYLTVNLTEIKESTLVCELEPTKLTFKATAGAYVFAFAPLDGDLHSLPRRSTKGIEEKDYEFALDLFEEIDPEVRN